MKTKCDEVREKLTSTAGTELPGEERRHLDDCPACRRYAQRADAARRYFQKHRSDAVPDAAFVARVADRINGRSVGAMGWAAMRLLPATLALAVILAWFVFQAAPYPEANGTLSPTDDLLSWVLDQEEVGP
jgi:predicted anti-sigma-YlaC factor YlaD